MADKPPFDPTQPFDTKPPFDPSAPFSTAPAYRASQQPAGAEVVPDWARDETPDWARAETPGALPPASDFGAIAPEGSMVGDGSGSGSLAKAARNAPGSALQFGKDIVQPFIHPVDTATGIKNLGMGLLEKAGIVSGDEHKKYADAVGSYFADRYGGLENAKRTFENDPVGMAGDLSMLLSGGETALARVPGIVGKVGETAGAVGRAVDPMRPLLRAGSAAGDLAGRAGAEIAGVTTGAGSQPFRVAANAGYEGGPSARAFRENMSGAAPLEEAVDDARQAVRQLRQERGDAYRQAMARIGADDTVLDFGKIDQAVDAAQGVKTYAGRSGTGPAQNLSPKTAGIRQEMTDAIDAWKALDPAEFHTAEGFDALKQQLGDIRDATQPNTPERVAADRIYNGVRQSIIDQAPEYARVMRGYEQASNQIKDIERTLSLNQNASIDTALRKLQSTLRDNVNTTYGRRTELANYLVNAGAPHLMEKLAGQALHSWAPRGLSRLIAAGAVEGPLALGAGIGAAAKAVPALAPMSPRLMGNVAYGAGRVAREAPRLSALARPARQIGRLSNATNPYSQLQ